MKKGIWDLACIVLGNTLLAFGIGALVLEYQILAGGVSGIGMILQHFLGLPVSASVMVCNAALFLVGLVILGKKFALGSLLSTFLFPLLLSFFEGNALFQGSLQDPLLASILAGVFAGVGIGLVMRAGASTGGIDILAIVLNRKFGVPVHLVLNAVDFLILLLQFPFHDIPHIVYGVITVAVTSAVLNRTLAAGTRLLQVMVFSDAYAQIRTAILETCDAGVTLLMSEKGYTETPSRVLLTVIPHRKLGMVRQQISRTDPQAFVVVSQISEVGGRGFTLERSNGQNMAGHKGSQ